MMSGTGGTARAISRTNKDKASRKQQIHSSKTDGTDTKMQATPEQMRLAQVTDRAGKDDELEKKIQELAELSGKDKDDIAIALHDCENDLNRAYLMLVEGENDQGEWKEFGKKKKKHPPAQKEAVVNNHAGESKPERSENSHRVRNDRDGDRDRDKENVDFTRNESNSRRGRRDTRPPRLSRGRGRERDQGSDMVWRETDGENDRGRDEGSVGGMRDRGRGRGRGVNGAGRRGGRGGGRGGETNRTFRSPRYDKGPQIDTWTNETAENARKEVQVEDWNDDSWTGSLTESKVFTSTSIGDLEEQPTQITDTTNGIHQNTAMPQRLGIGALLQKAPNDVGVVSSVQDSQFISQYNKEATESIKNSIGIGSANRSALPATSVPNNPVSQLASLGSLTGLHQPSRIGAPHSVSPPVSMQQRPKPQKSKLPPPSKIPASAVEMPGDMVTSLDVQFGNLEFGSDSFSFGGTDSIGNNSFPNTTTNSVRYQIGAPGLTNHLEQVTSPEQSLSTPNKSTTMSSLDQTSPRANMFPNTYSTTPTKKEINSPEPIPFPTSQSELKTSPLVSSQRPSQNSNSLQGSLSSNPADSALYGQSSAYQSYKSTGLNSAQNYASSTLSQNVQYPNSLASQNSANQFQAAQNQFPTSSNQYSGYQAGYVSQPNQNSLYQSATSTGSYSTQSGSIYPSRDSQSGSSFQTNVTQSSASSFQRDSQTGSSYPRDSQPSATSYQRESQASGSSYPSQQSGPFPRESQPAAAYSRDSQSTSSFSRDSQPTSSYGRDSQTGPYQREGQGASVVYSRDSQSSTAYQRDPQGTGSYNVRDGPSASSAYQRDSQSAGFQREPSSSSNYSRDNQPASSYHRDSQSAGSSYGRENPATNAANFQRDNTPSQSAYSQQTYSTTNHQSTLQTSPLTVNKLSDSLSKMGVKDNVVENHQVSQHSYDSSTTSTSGLTSASSTVSSSLASVVTTAVSTPSSTNISTNKMNLSSTSSTSKAPPNLPPGVPLLNAQYIMNMNQGLPPYFSLQQPLYSGYDELQLLQQRGMPLGSYYDMSSFGAPTTLAGRDQTTLGNVPYTGGEGKLNRVDAQSPVPTTQPQQSQTTHQQQLFNPALHPSYGYYPYAASMLPGGFQYPHTMFMPPVTNTAAHGGSTASNQYQKAYGSHSYAAGKGYEDMNQAQDFSKAYGVGPSQSKVSGSVSSVSSGSGSGTDLTGYGKSHAQVNAFDKQSFHAGTPNSFNLPMTSVSQGGPLANPYHHQYMPMMPPHQAHSMLHHSLQQDSGSSGRGSQQSATQPKSAGSKPYGSYWGAN